MWARFEAFCTPDVDYTARVDELMEPTTIGAWIAVAVAAGGVIAGSVKFAFWVYDECQRRKNHQGFVVPKKTLEIAGKTESNYWWGMGKRGDEPTMQIVGSFFISNISSVPVRVPQAELRYGFLGRKRVNGIVMVPRSAKDNLHGFYDIPPNETRNAPFDFWVYPPVAKVGEDFTARSVTFIDQFGNRHSVKKVTFRPHDADRPKPPKRPAEFAYEIADPVEKEVVSALQSEARTLSDVRQDGWWAWQCSHRLSGAHFHGCGNRLVDARFTHQPVDRVRS